MDPARIETLLYKGRWVQHAPYFLQVVGTPLKIVQKVTLILWFHTILTKEEAPHTELYGQLSTQQRPVLAGSTVVGESTIL